jgi:type II secretory pathway component PulK
LTKLHLPLELGRVMHKPKKSQSCSGSALLVVLLMLGLLAVLAIVVSRSLSVAALEMRAARDSSQAEIDVRAGIDLGVAAVLKLGDDVRSADAEVVLPDRQIIVVATNERARIDINQADAEILTGLLKAARVDDNEAAALATNVLRWRGSVKSEPQESNEDGGDFRGPPHLGSFNTTTGFQPQATPKQKATIRFFLHPMQLASVPGFTNALIKAVFPLVTVASGSMQIDPFIASSGVLNALPESTPGKVEAFIEARDGNTSPDTAILLLGVDKHLFTDEPAVGWRLQITSTPRVGRPHRGEAVVAISKDGSEPYQVLYITDDERGL